MCGAALVWAAPQNNSIQQQSSWNGWGGLVDWSFRSLRIGLALQDSLLEDGWLLADSILVTYLEADSLHVEQYGSVTFRAVTDRIWGVWE